METVEKNPIELRNPLTKVENGKLYVSFSEKLPEKAFTGWGNEFPIQWVEATQLPENYRVVCLPWCPIEMELYDDVPPKEYIATV